MLLVGFNSFQKIAELFKEIKHLSTIVKLSTGLSKSALSDFL
jgi:hypothetical protein